MRVTSLEGPSLDFWVAKSKGLEVVGGSTGGVCVAREDQAEAYHPSTDWTQGGPIVSDEWYDLEEILDQWFGPGWPYAKPFASEPLKWLMRAYVASQFGDEVEDLADVGQVEERLLDETHPGGGRWRVFDFLRGLGRSSGHSGLSH